MLTHLDRVTLKSGESLDVAKVTAPEPGWLERIVGFLQHKGEHWLWPMRLAYTEGLPTLTMSCYQGLLDGEIVGNITTFEALERPVGILGHVFTLPEHRRKGIASHLLQAVMDDFHSRRGRAMYLGTGFETPPYWLYHSFGFRGRGTSGKMQWFASEDFEADFFAPGATEVRDTTWGDWALLEALHAIVDGWYLRGFLMKQYGHCGYEGTYSGLRQGMQDGRVVDVKELAKTDGAVVGHAYLAQWDAWPGSPLMLELFMHPSFYGEGVRLVEALAIPESARVCAFADETAPEKAQILEACGFEREGVLKRQIEGRLDVAVYGR